MGQTAKEKTPVKCVECGSIIPLSEKAWRKCFMCGDSICIEHTYFILTRRQ